MPGKKNEMTLSTGLGKRLVPSLLVRDMEATLLFYQQLGFQVTGSHPPGEPPFWAEVSQDGVVFQFFADPPQGTLDHPICSGVFYIFPQDVKALAEKLQDKTEFLWGPEVMDYGMLEFAIRDPNGYILAFTEPADQGEMS